MVPPPPDRPDRDSRWYLGVEVDYRDYGAVITRVRRPSPAQRAGLEPRDVIVTVRGYQVGYVNNRLYPLDRELDLRADRRGNVLLLVQNQRNGTLTATPIRLERFDRPLEPPRVAPLTGTVTSRRIGQLPRGAVLTVRLVDISDSRSARTIIAQRRYTDLGPLPIPFELDYDPDQIEPEHAYALQAAVVVNGIPTYQTERYKVFSDGVPQRVDMVLESSR
jgi:putative lipoprotein